MTRAAGKRVLLIEDDAMNLELLQAVLEGDGFAVSGCRLMADVDMGTDGCAMSKRVLNRQGGGPFHESDHAGCGENDSGSQMAW